MRNGRSADLQPYNPFSNFVMGRSFWLRDDAEGSKLWFSRAIEASPNFALGYFASSWADTFTEAYGEGDEKTDKSMDLSPLDPMCGGMLCNKMWVSIAAEDFDAAVKWAEACTRTPGTHAGLTMFAAMANLLNGGDEKALHWKKEALQRNPDLQVGNLKAVIPSTHTKFHALIDNAANKLGI